MTDIVQLLRCCVIALVAASFASAQEKTAKRPGGANASFAVREFRGTNNQVLRYSLFVPPNRGAEKLPLVLCLHGAGGNTAAADVLVSAEMQKTHPCVVMAPACDTATARWVESSFGRGANNRAVTPELIEALDSVVREANADPTRIYLTGQSMGGIGTWGLLAKHAEKFAAAVPVCGIWPPEDAPKMNGVPIWAFHGDMDPRVPVRGSRDMIAALKKAAVSPEPRYTELPGVGHGSWGPAYATTEMWDWLFSQRRSAAPQMPLKVTTDFEGGSAKILEINSQTNTIRIAPGGDANRGWVCWWSVRIDNTMPGQAVTLELNASEQPTRNSGKLLKTPLAAGWSMAARASISHDGHSWQHSAPGQREANRIRYPLIPEGKSLWVAWGPPFTPKDTEELFANATAKLPGARSFELARTRENRPVMGLRVSADNDGENSKRPAVWIEARQHAWESGSSWVARGLVEWLMTREDSAHWLTENTEVVIVPIMDVDNVTTGNGGKEENPRDHNRDWDEAPVFPEVAAAQKQLLKWAEQGRLDFFIDLHNPAPNDPRPFFFVGPPEFLSDVSRGNRSLFLEIAQKHINSPLPVEPAPRVTGPSYHPLWRKISGQWVTDHGNEHTLAICLETAWNTPDSTTAGYRTVGRQLGESIAEYLQRRQRN